MELGPYAGFIVAAYCAALVGIVIDHRAQRRTLADLEARGITRRSS
jgi:heme exporter protein D